MVLPAYRLMIHNMSLYGALPYVNSVNQTVKQTGVLPQNLFSNNELHASLND